MQVLRFVDAFFEQTRGSTLEAHHEALRQQLKQRFHDRPHGDTARWEAVLAQLPEMAAETCSLSTPCIRIGEDHPTEPPLTPLLQTLKPWRKGPFQLFDTHIDTEWRSNLKWQRLAPHISSLAGRTILDVGSGNGYYLLRMLGAGASLAVGVDPTRLFLYQFHVLRHFLPDLAAYLLPLRGEDLPAFGSFDTVFSLGVLYHRRSPLDHLAELYSFLRPGGELVLETLVVEGDARQLLIPPDRYARMANVWFLPSAAMLETWLLRLGFEAAVTVSTNRTTTFEQRSTPWMDFHSLSDFLDPEDASLTVEGLPAPRRAIIIARRPG